MADIGKPVKEIEKVQDDGEVEISIPIPENWPVEKPVLVPEEQ